MRGAVEERHSKRSDPAVLDETTNVAPPHVWRPSGSRKSSQLDEALDRPLRDPEPAGDTASSSHSSDCTSSTATNVSEPPTDSDLWPRALAKMAMSSVPKTSPRPATC